MRGLAPDGTVVVLQLLRTSDGEIRLRAIGHETPVRTSSGGLTVALALIKRMAHLDFVIEKGTELGVSAWWAVLTAHCADAGLMRSYVHRLARWRRIAEAASLQSGRSVVPEIRGVLSWEELLREAGACPRRYVAVPHAKIRLRDTPRQPSSRALFLVGPEGGWSRAEESSLQEAGFVPVALGHTVLRSETAALVGSVLLAP